MLLLSSFQNLPSRNRFFKWLNSLLKAPRTWAMAQFVDNSRDHSLPVLPHTLILSHLDCPPRPMAPSPPLPDQDSILSDHFRISVRSCRFQLRMLQKLLDFQACSFSNLLSHWLGCVSRTGRRVPCRLSPRGIGPAIPCPHPPPDFHLAWSLIPLVSTLMAPYQKGLPRPHPDLPSKTEPLSSAHILFFFMALLSI